MEKTITEIVYYYEKYNGRLFPLYEYSRKGGDAYEGTDSQPGKKVPQNNAWQHSPIGEVLRNQSDDNFFLHNNLLQFL